MFVRPAVREGSVAVQSSTDGDHQSRDIVDKYYVHHMQKHKR